MIENSNNSIYLSNQLLQDHNYKKDTDIMTEKLNAINYLNLIAFIVNIVITYGVGTAGWFGAKSNGEISDMYQTIITPNSKAFTIWSVIFLTEAIFVIVQFLPRYRSTALVQKGVRYWFILSCLFQTAWTFPFSFEIMWLALVLIILIGVSLAAILISQYYIECEEKKGFFNYFFFQFPFEVHCGWIIAASILNANILNLQMGASEAMQLAAGIVSLGLLLMITTFVLFFPTTPNFIIPLVAAWASGWISVELKNPKSSITDEFDTVIIEAMQTTSVVIWAIILIVTVIRACLFLLANNFGILPCFGNVDNGENDGGIQAKPNVSQWDTTEERHGQQWSA